MFVDLSGNRIGLAVSALPLLGQGMLSFSTEALGFWTNFDRRAAIDVGSQFCYGVPFEGPVCSQPILRALL